MPSARAAAADAVEPVPVSSKADIAIALDRLNAAKADFAAVISEAHTACTHTVWIERGTFSVADWLSPHSAVRFCRDCRAEMHDAQSYRDWLSFGEYSHNKPASVELVLTPQMAGVKGEIYALRLPSDPRPHFANMAEVHAWRAQGDAP